MPRPHPNDLDCSAERARIVAFIREQLRSSGCSCLVLGLSGGIDSALVAALCVEAVGAERVHALLLPHETSNPQSEAHGMVMAHKLGIAHERFDITPLVTPLLDAEIRTRGRPMDGRRQGNIMARSRMIVLFDRSARLNGLVVGTSNRTETLLGYFTLHGDGAAAFKPIAHLYKAQVRTLARHMDIPEEIIAKAPSADLWEGQTDEGELGFSYDEADRAIYYLTERRYSIEETAAQGLRRQVVEAIARRMASTAFKRRPPPELAVDCEE